MTQQKKGFTLVELMVVMSVISILSSVVFGSLAGARNRGRIAAGELQASNLYHAIGNSIITKYSFDECSGSTAKDTSGSNNDGIISGGTWDTSTYNNTGCSISLNGSSYVYANAQASISGSNSRTVSMWFKTTSTANQPLFDSGSSGTNNNAFEIYTAGAGGIGFIGGGGPGGIYLALWGDDVFVPIAISSIANGNWHFIAVSYDGSTNTISIYFDGNLYDSYFQGSGLTLLHQPIVVTKPITTQNPIWIGQSRAQLWSLGATNFTGSIDDVNIFTNSVLSFDIKKLYEKGLTKHLALNP